jgi:ankyrin repeat protein
MTPGGVTHRKRILVLLCLAVALVCSCEKNPAREKLEQMDVRYSKKEFLKRVEKSDYDVVELFLAAGMNPDARDKTGATALQYAAREGNLEIVKLLMEKGADVNRGAVLAWAIAGLERRTRREPGQELVKLPRDEENARQAEVIRYLVEHGADVNAGTPLHSAVRAGDLEIVRLLVEHGADINATNGRSKITALMRAAQYAPPEVVQYLLDHGADPNAKTVVYTQDSRQMLKEIFTGPQEGRTALQIAEALERHEIVKMLKEAGAK